jgi:hypothetical protein
VVPVLVVTFTPIVYVPATAQELLAVAVVWVSVRPSPQVQV